MAWYAKKDYDGKMPKGLAENVSRLLKGTTSNLKGLTAENLSNVLEKVFTGELFLAVTKIDWESVRDRMKAEREILRSL